MSPLYLIVFALCVGKVESSAKPATLKQNDQTTTSIIMEIVDSVDADEGQSDFGYTIERYAKGDTLSGTPVGSTINAPLTQSNKVVTDINLTPGTQYDYRVTVKRLVAKRAKRAADEWETPVGSFHTMATQQTKPTIVFKSATTDSITLDWTNFDNYEEDYSVTVDGKETNPTVKDFTISGLAVASKYVVTATAKQFEIVSEELNDLNICTAPLAPTVVEEMSTDGTTLVMKITTAKSALSGIEIVFSGTVEQPTASLGVATLTDKTVDYTHSFAEETEYTLTFNNYPKPAPTYKVIPYFNDAGQCPEKAKLESHAKIANKEAMFVYGVVGLMAFILRALGLQPNCLF